MKRNIKIGAVLSFTLFLTALFHYIDPINFYEKLGMAILTVIVLLDLVERIESRRVQKQEHMHS